MNCFPSNGGAAAVITGQPPARHCVGTVHGGARAGQSCEESWRSILAHPGGRPSQWCRGIGGCTSVATPTALEEHCAGNVRRLQLQLPHALHVAALPRSPTLSLVQRLIRKAPHAYTTHTRIRSITQIHTRAASAQDVATADFEGRADQRPELRARLAGCESQGRGCLCRPLVFNSAVHDGRARPAQLAPQTGRLPGTSSRRRDCHLMAPPCTCSRCFNGDKEGVPVK